MIIVYLRDGKEIEVDNGQAGRFVFPDFVQKTEVGAILEITDRKAGYGGLVVASFLKEDVTGYTLLPDDAEDK